MKFAIAIGNARECEPSNKLIAMASEAEVIFAADGGANHCKNLGVQPHEIWGDEDSISPSTKSYFEKVSKSRTFPIKKDKTDLALVLEELDRLNLDEIRIFAWSDERIDYSFGALLDFAKILTPIRAYGRNFELISLNSKRPSDAPALGTPLSIIRIDSQVKIQTLGLEWDFSWDSRSQYLLSQSNKVKAEGAKIEVSSGTAFVLFPQL